MSSAAEVCRPGKVIEQPTRSTTAFATREARIVNQDAIIAVLGESFRRRSRDAWCDLLSPKTCRTRRVRHHEALEVAAQHLQLTTSSEHPVMGLSARPIAVSFDGERALEVRPPPTLGEHNDEIRAAVKSRKAAAKA